MLPEFASTADLFLDHATVTMCGARPSNQDATGEAHQDDLSCFVVSDGVGGYEGGAIAASLVVEAVRHRFLEEGAFGARALYSYVSHAADCVRARQLQHPMYRNMSATVAALLIDRRNCCATWMHVGDTRLYLFRNGVKIAVTKDHSVAQQFVDAGYCKPDGLATHPGRAQLFAAIGADDDSALPFSVSESPLLPGDDFLLCTDGLWECLNDQRIVACLADSKSAHEWLSAIQTVCEGAGHSGKPLADNASAVAVRVTK